MPRKAVERMLNPLRSWGSYADHAFTDLQDAFVEIHKRNAERDTYTLNTVDLEKLVRLLDFYTKELKPKEGTHEYGCCTALKAGLRQRFIAHQWQTLLLELDPRRGLSEVSKEN